MSSRKFVDGMAVRREVLGDEYVDRALANATEFTQPLQDLVTENCWGEIWTRDALPRRTRSPVTPPMVGARATFRRAAATRRSTDRPRAAPD